MLIPPDDLQFLYGCLSKRVALMVSCMAGSAGRHVIAFNTQTSVDIGVLQVAKARESWLGAEPLLRTAWQQATQNQPASRGRVPSSFGRYPSGPSQSGSSEKEGLPEPKAADAVAFARPLGVPEAGQAGARAAERVKV